MKDCTGFITDIQKLPRSEDNKPPIEEVIQLGWAHDGRTRAIPPGTFFYMDVVTKVEGPDGKMKILTVPELPYTLKEYVQQNGEFEVTVRVAADNATPRDIVFRYTNSDEARLQHTPKDCSDFPVLVRAQRHLIKGRDDAIGALDDAGHRLAEGREHVTGRLIEGRNYVKSRLIVGRDRVQRLLRRRAADQQDEEH